MWPKMNAGSSMIAKLLMIDDISVHKNIRLNVILENQLSRFVG